MQPISNYFSKPSIAFDSFITRFCKWLPDILFLKIRYRLNKGSWPNLKNPQLFSEKIQWLKLYNHKPEYSKMVDKYEVKEYVSSIIGEKYVIPTLGIWDNPDDIDWEELPRQFVLKTTNGGGSCGVIICKDKRLLNKDETLKKLKYSMKGSIYESYREWPYKNVKARIIAEQYMEGDNGSLDDYKFSCFDGRANDVMVCFDRGSGDTKFYFFDKDWNLLPLNIRGKNAPHDFTLPKPSCMDEMFEIAGKLSSGLPYARIDLYAVKGRPYFGEITFFPASGFDKNLLLETEKLHGSMIKLPVKMI